MTDIEQLEGRIEELEDELLGLRSKYNAARSGSLHHATKCVSHEIQVRKMKNMIGRLCSALGDFEVDHPVRLEAIEMTRKITPGAVIHAQYE